METKTRFVLNAFISEKIEVACLKIILMPDIIKNIAVSLIYILTEH